MCKFLDWDPVPLSVDGTFPENSAIVRFHALLQEALAKMDREYSPGKGLKKWVIEAGYVDVTEKVVSVPIGMWAKDKDWCVDYNKSNLVRLLMS